ncbi:hypothetical protein ACLB2K_048700 [Fragaria x ananassa]
MFQKTLAGEALSWFYELPSNLVDYFRELADKVRSFDKKVAEEAFIQGLLPGKFLYAVKIENPQAYDELMEMAIRHAQADHDTYGATSAEKRKDEGRDGWSPVQVIQEVRAWKGEREPDSGPAGKKHNAQGKTKRVEMDVLYNCFYSHNLNF